MNKNPQHKTANAIIAFAVLLFVVLFVSPSLANIPSYHFPLHAEFSYDKAGNLKEETDGKGHRTEYTYDRNNRRLTATHAGLRVETLEYDPAGNTLFRTDARGTKEGWEYDPRNLVTAHNRPLAMITRYTRDSMGDVTEERDPEGRQIKSDWDKRQRLISSTVNGNETTTTAYDANNNATRTTKPGGGSTETVYTAHNLPSTIKTSVGESRWTYNGNGIPASRSDALTQTTGYTIDQRGRRTQVTHPNSTGTIVYTYDLANRLKTTVENGITTTHTFDVRGRETRRDYSGGGLTRTAWTWDGNGNLTSETVTEGGNNRTVQMQYDAFDRVERITDTFGNVLTHTYDANGNRTTTTAPGISFGSTGNQVTRYTWDVNNRMTNLSSGTATIGWQYDRSGRVTRTTYPGGVTTDQTWDGAARLTSRTHKTNNATQQSFTYTYDKNGNRTNETRNLDGVGNSTSAETINYDYDTDDRLTNVTYSDGRSETYTLDANGNRRQITRSGYAAGSYSNENGTTINAFDARGRIENKQTPSGTITYTWDAAGNLKEVRRGTETTTYTWNPENQLIAIQQNGAPIATYRYTQGLRDQVQTSGETNRTVWNDGFAFLKQDHSGNTLTRTEHAGTKAIYLTGAYGNEILLRDGLDSVTGSVVNGALQSRTDYGSWGEATQTGTTQSNHGYTGHLQDDTGLIYARARYYDPSIGRFISKDPLEGLQNSPISWNAYLYANANPFYYVDPSGEIPIAVPIIIGGLALADYLLSDKREQAQELIQPESYAGFVGAEAYAFSQATANTLSLGYYDRVKQEGWGGYASQTRNITGATHFDAVQREIFAEGGDPVLAGLHATAGTSQAMLMAGMTAPMVQRTGAVLQNSSQRAGTWVREKVDSVLIKEGNSIATAVEVNATTRSVVSGAETRGGVATATGSSLQAKWGHLSASERRALLEVKAEANAFRRLQEMEAAMPRAHYLERHGAQLNLQSQFDRVAYGFNPTTGAQQYIPSAATRFMSHRDQLNVIMRSENIYRATGDVFLARRPIRFDSVVGSGFQRDSLNYGVQYSGRALLDSSGKAVSAFPVWGNK